MKTFNIPVQQYIETIAYGTATVQADTFEEAVEALEIMRDWEVDWTDREDNQDLGPIEIQPGIEEDDCIEEDTD